MKSMELANQVLRYLGVAGGLAVAASGVLRPEWEVRWASGQTQRPSTWVWEQPDLAQLVPLSSEVDWFVGCQFIVGGLRRAAEGDDAAGHASHRS